MNLIRNTIAVAALAFASSAAFAGTSPQTADFDVSITLQNDCTITFNDINHGTVPSLAADRDADSVGDNITCSFADSYTIALNVGTGGGTYATRTLANGPNTLNFNVYSDAARTTIWGDGSGGSAVLTKTSTGGGVADAIDVHSRVFGGQTGKPEGTYSSTITATATF
jgi:spore coat protein U-like protein